MPQGPGLGIAIDRDTLDALPDRAMSRVGPRAVGDGGASAQAYGSRR